MTMRRLLAGLIWALAAVFSAQALAAPDEIQVYTEELNQPGQFGLEQHINFTVQGVRVPDYPGQLPPHHVAQVTPEFSYGVSDTLEAGLYVPLALAPGGGSYLNGLRLRLKYIAPHVEYGWFQGLNVELGRQVARTSDSLSTLELRPIVGYHGVDWRMSFNPILNTGLTAHVSHIPQFAPALKVARRLSEGLYAGVECYSEFGAWNRPLPFAQRSQMAYLVLDVEYSGFEMNLGVGRGFQSSPDHWVIKSILALSLD